nr:hypothetical protein [Achromobacter ruhlandii]
QAPLRRNVTIDDVGNVAAFMLSDLAGGGGRGAPPRGRGGGGGPRGRRRRAGAAGGDQGAGLG